MKICKSQWSHYQPFPSRSSLAFFVSFFFPLLLTSSPLHVLFRCCSTLHAIFPCESSPCHLLNSTRSSLTILFYSRMACAHEGVNGVVMSFFVNFCFFFPLFQHQFTSYSVILSSVATEPNRTEPNRIAA
jgi:hypothetical protein